MNTMHNLKKKLITSTLGAAVAGAAAPALLLLGAGTAHADDVTYDLWTGSDLIAHVQDTTGRDSLCTYNSKPTEGLLPFPYYSPPFWVPAGANVPVDIPAPIATRTTWYINVNCVGNQSPTTVNGGPDLYSF